MVKHGGRRAARSRASRHVRQTKSRDARTLYPPLASSHGPVAQRSESRSSGHDPFPEFLTICILALAGFCFAAASSSCSAASLTSTGSAAARGRMRGSTPALVFLSSAPAPTPTVSQIRSQYEGKAPGRQGRQGRQGGVGMRAADWQWEGRGKQREARGANGVLRGEGAHAACDTRRTRP